MPTAVISGASLGALRSGRYATRSISTFSTPQAIIATTSDGQDAADEAEHCRRRA